MNEYLRKDVFEAKMDALMAEIRLGNEQLRREIDKRFNEVNERFSQVDMKIESVKSDVKALNVRVGSLETVVYWGLALIGIILAAPSLSEFLKSLRKPSLTAEDVEKIAKRIINSNNLKIEG